MVAAVGFLLAASALHLPVEPQHWISDWITVWASERPESQHKEIVLVLIDDNTLQDYPYIAPIDRKLLANLILKLDEAGAKTIGLDFVFSRRTEAIKDEYLKEVINGARARVVLGVLDDRTPLPAGELQFQGTFIKRIKNIERTAGHLYFDEEHSSSLVISNHVVRLIGKPSKSGWPSFAEVLTERSTLGGHAHPEQFISWLRNPPEGEPFRTWSAKAIIDNGKLGSAIDLKRYFADKIVLIGGSFHDRDQHLTPLSVQSGQRYAGVSIHAQVVAQLLDGRWLRAPDWFGWGILVLLTAAAGAWVGWRLHLGVWEFLVEVALIAIVLGASFAALKWAWLLLPSTAMILAGLAGAAAGRHARASFH